MYIYAIIIMVLMLLVAMGAEMTVKKRELDNNLLHSRLEIQNQHIERLEREAKERDAYDTRLNLYQEAVLPAFARKLDEKKCGSGSACGAAFCNGGGHQTVFGRFYDQIR